MLGLRKDLDAGGAVGRGEGPAEAKRARALRRPAAASVHRASARRRARGDPARRAGVGARPDRDVEHRRPDPRAEARLHDRDRHAQHAAGGARRRHDGVLQPRRARRRLTQRHPRRVRRDAEDLHPACRFADGGLCNRTFRMRISFQEQLDRTETALQEEGELVLRALRGALNALWEQDPELSDEVIAFDDRVDALYFNIQGGIQALLAQQTPVAGDLRLVLALLYSNLHLERMGDYCVTIAKLVKLASEFDPEPALIDAFADMGARAEGMIHVALDAFAQRDVDAAESLVELDELIDRANRREVGHGRRRPESPDEGAHDASEDVDARRVRAAEIHRAVQLEHDVASRAES